MNTQSPLSVVPDLPSQTPFPDGKITLTVFMTCDVCDLVGGPFSVAEAAHLRSIHKRMQHGITTAA
jgi:hypothetical protein